MAQTDPILLGTRGSELALTQTRMTTAALQALHLEREVRHEIIHTTGDKRQDLRLASPDLDKAVFTKELEEALLAGTVHAAVHSLKDVPTILEPEFEIAAVLERAPIEDVLITKDPDHVGDGFENLPEGATVATSSLRRHHQIQFQRPDLKIVEIRGNVATRLRKVATLDEIHATILARAGLTRLGHDLSKTSLNFEDHTLGMGILSPEILLPAASQGAIGIEIRSSDAETRDLLQKINHQPTWQRIQAERAFLKALGAGCQTPVGVHTRHLDETTLRMTAIVFSEDDPTTPQRGEVTGSAENSDELATQLLNQLS